MKNFLKMFGAIGLLAGMLIAGGCGDDVVSGPVPAVVDAKVQDAKVYACTDSTGAVSDILTTTDYSVTDGNGRPTKQVNGAASSTFYLPADKGFGYKSVGGTYYIGTNSYTAANMLTPKGYVVVSPLSKIAYTDPATANALLASIGLNMNSDFVNATSLNAKAAMVFMQYIGSLLSQSAAVNGGEPTAAVVTNLLTILSAKSSTGTYVVADTLAAAVKAGTDTAVSTSLTTAITTSVFGNANVATAATALTTAGVSTATAATEANAFAATVAVGTRSDTGSTGGQTGGTKVR